MIGFLKLRAPSEGRVFGLDIIRAAAIVMVLTDHSKIFFSPFYAPLNYLSIFGFYGVELFFVLSGYLIGSILIRSLFENKMSSLGGLLDFWKRRWFRTLPNYFLVLTICMIVYRNYLHENVMSIKPYLFFTQNLYHHIPAFFMESWSLSVEEWFYILIPFSFFLLGHRSISSSARKYLLLGCILSMIFLFTLIRYLYSGATNMEDWNLNVRQVVIYRLDAVGYGVLLAYFQYFYDGLLNRYRNTFLILGVVLLFVSTFWYVGLFNNTLPMFWANNLLFAATSIGFACLFPALVRINDRSNSLFKRSITHVSLISYSIYLLNYSLILGLLLKNYAATNFMNAFTFLMLFWILTVFAATLLFKYYERPMTGIRDKIAFDKKAHIVK